MEKNLAALFPGVRYGTDCPLLYYAALEYRRRNFETLSVDYGQTKSDLPLAEYAEKAAENAAAAIEKFSPSKREKITFISKSVGTAIALRVEDILGLKNIEHILLTPINETLPLMNKGRNYKRVVSSDADSYIDAAKLEKLCAEINAPLSVFRGLGHRLECGGGAEANVKILEDIVKLY